MAERKGFELSRQRNIVKNPAKFAGKSTVIES